MNRYEPWVYGLLLAVSLGLAWAAWKDDAPSASTSVVIFEAPSGGVKEVIYEVGPEKAHMVVTGGEDEHRTTWISWTQPAPVPPKPVEPPRPPEPPRPAVDADAGPDALAADAPSVDSDATTPDDASDASDASDAAVAVADLPDAATPPPSEPASAPTPIEPADEVVGPPVTREFPGNAVASGLLGSFDTLRALRQFDNVDDARLEAMGLKTPQGHLRVVADGKELELELGNTAYGAVHQYARPKGGGPVYLLSRDLIGPLKNASARLMERRLIAFEPEDIAGIELVNGASSVKLLHRDARKKATAHWTRATDEERSDSLDGFVDKLLQLGVTHYPVPGEEPDAVSLEPVLKASVVGKDGPLVTFELARGQKAGAPAWFGRSTATKAWVELSEGPAADVADNVGSVMP